MIQILQIGTENWNECYEVPDYVNIHYEDEFKKPSKNLYDMVFIDRELQKEEIEPLCQSAKAYTVYVTDEVCTDDIVMKSFLDRNKAKVIKKSEVQSFLSNEAKNYFVKPYGEKFRMQHMSVAQDFTGKIQWNGNYSLNLDGDYGEELKQIVFWRNNLPIEQGQAIELWLEYKKEPEVEIELKVTQFLRGSLSTVQKQWIFSERELDELVVLDNQMQTGQIFISLQARGKGKLQVIALHDRISRRGHGAFIPGGQRYVSSDREEIFYYFDPGDMKPPLNVYFSGYKTLQGFEGYYMMKKMGCPFLLIAEPRLEGGCFYMGSEEYEKAYVDIINNCIKELGFTNEQVILSGLSMGTFGAMYYGCDILPHAIILGKPLASIGDVAANERLHRPGGFPTSIDVLNYIAGDTDKTAIERLNKKFWDKFDSTKWGKSKLVVAYMIEDDYDNRAYNNLISHVKIDGMQVYGKGIHGRHNDATSPIILWFKNQYDKILTEDFLRRIKD